VKAEALKVSPRIALFSGFSPVLFQMELTATYSHPKDHLDNWSKNYCTRPRYPWSAELAGY